jgi:hypothetical protein
VKERYAMKHLHDVETLRVTLKERRNVEQIVQDRVRGAWRNFVGGLKLKRGIGISTRVRPSQKNSTLDFFFSTTQKAKQINK